VKLRASILVATTLTALCACVAETPARGRAYVDIDVRPPPERVLVVPAPRRGYAWAPGYWRWNGRRHVWVEGRWVRERPGYHWVPAHWEERHNRWHFEDGHWER
jgi:WXXGXW repeat (2 copies)